MMSIPSRLAAGLLFAAVSLTGEAIHLLHAADGPATRPAEHVTPNAAANAPAAEPSKAASWRLAYLRVPANLVAPVDKDLWRDSMTLSFAGVEAPFRVYLNGKLIIESDAIPGEARKRFKVPKDILVVEKFNVLAVQVAGSNKPFGKPPIFAGYFDELLLEQWETTAKELTPDDPALAPVASAPKTAVYTEAGFKPSSTPLDATMQTMPGQRLTPAESLAKMKTGEGLAVDLLLAEPLVAQPTHLSFDERGRLWVSQYRQYPYPAGVKMISRDKYYRGVYDRMPPAPPNHDKGRDVISVHEDADGDGVFDKHKVVLDGLNMANAAVRGAGGIWVMHTPHLMFYPDADGDDVPDRAPEVRLSGFGLEDTHSVANGLIWGPDGWLYGGQGSTTTSRVTRPGVDPAGAPGVYFEGCMVWRYHPATKVYEIFAEGGGNTFGLEFDAEGRLYSGHNGGQTRGWHFIRAGLFLKQGVDPGKFGPQTNAYAFGELQMMPTRNPVPRFTHNVVVAEGTGIPESLRGRFIGTDPLHRNLVASERYPLGSTFETSDIGVPLAGDDIAFRPVFLANAPDGSLYLADFYEEYIAHGQNYQGQIDPTTGRIYRIRGKETPLGKDVDLSKLSTEQLVKTLLHANRWHRQTAVRLLGEKRDPAATPLLVATLKSSETHPAVEALWALFQAGGMTDDVTLAALAHPSPIVRAWAVRLSADVGPIADRVFPAVRELATREANAEVRCQIAAAARRIPAEHALPLVGELLKRNEDAADAFIPLLNWWTVESHCDTSRADVLAMLTDAGAWESTPMRDVIVPRLMRRFASSGTRADLLTCAKLLSAAPKPEHAKKLMEGFEQAFAGRTPPPLPKELAEALAKTGPLSPILRFRLGEEQAIADAVKLAGDPKAKAEDRLAVVTLLGEIETPSAAPTLLGIARGDEPFVAPIEPGPTAAAMTKSTNDLRKSAVAALSRYADPKIAADVAAAVKTMPTDVRPAAINLLSSRPTHAKHLLHLIDAGTVARTEVPAEIVSRLTAMQDDSVANRAEKLFAAPVIPAEQAKAERAAKADQIRKAVAAAAGDPYKGEPIYMQRCGVCHTLFHKGGAIGPNLTAYQRGDLGTLLTSILNPNAEIREGFVNYNVTTKDRRSLGGFLTDNDPAVVTLRGFDGQDVRVPRDQIVDMKAAQGSLMPEGLLDGLSEVELRDLFAYLRIPQPITN